MLGLRVLKIKCAGAVQGALGALFACVVGCVNADARGPELTDSAGINHALDVLAHDERISKNKSYIQTFSICEAASLGGEVFVYWPENRWFIVFPRKVTHADAWDTPLLMADIDDAEEDVVRTDSQIVSSTYLQTVAFYKVRVATAIKGRQFLVDRTEPIKKYSRAADMSKDDISRSEECGTDMAR